MSATDTFADMCVDCGQPVDVVGGVTEAHECPIPELFRGRVSQASAESMRWTCEQAGHPIQLPDDLSCICATWAHRVEAGAVYIDCQPLTAQEDDR